MNPESVVIAGYYGFGNAGDELILYALIEQLRRENLAISITAFSKTPSETQNTFGIHAVDRWRPWTWLKTLVNADRFILGGGGLLQESTGPWNYVYYLGLLLVAKCFGCRTEILAMGVDSIRLSRNRFLTRFVLNHWADAISVRDDYSRKALLEAGVRYPIDIQRDPVFDLQLERHAKRSGRIAFAISPSKTRSRWNQGIAELCDLLAKQLDISVDFLILFPDEDETFARQVIHHAAFEPHLRRADNPIDLLSWIPQYDLVVGTRFHALVLATLSRTPMIGWGAQSKVAALCKETDSLYVNTELQWDVADQLNLIASLYRSKNESTKPPVGLMRHV